MPRMMGRPTIGPYVVVETLGKPLSVSPSEFVCRRVSASPHSSAVAGAIRSVSPNGFAVTKTGASEPPGACVEFCVGIDVAGPRMQPTRRGAQRKAATS